MIVRTVGSLHYLVAQAEHARQSAVIAASLAEEWLGPHDDRVATVRAAREHDAGWAEWDARPATRPDGLILPFDQIDLEDHEAVWRRSIFGALHRLGPAEAAIIARHSVALWKGTADDETARYELMLALGRRAWPGLDDADLRQRIEQAFSVLYFGDAVSLIGLAGWEPRIPLELRSADGARLHVEAWRDGDWTVRVHPWPFAMPALTNVFADAIVIPAGEEASAVPRLGHRGGFLMRVPVSILPAESP